MVDNDVLFIGSYADVDTVVVVVDYFLEFNWAITFSAIRI